MQSINQQTYLSFILSGIIFAGLSAGFDYTDGIEFSFTRFISKATLFGLVMAWITRRNLKKKEAEKKA